MTDDSSELSELSSVASIDSEAENVPAAKKGTILKYFPKIKTKQAPTHKDPTPPPRKRSPSPPHEPVLADNPDISVRWYPFRGCGVVVVQGPIDTSCACLSGTYANCLPCSSWSCTEADSAIASQSHSLTLGLKKSNAMSPRRSLETRPNSCSAQSWGCCLTGSRMSSKGFPPPPAIGYSRIPNKQFDKKKKKILTSDETDPDTTIAPWRMQSVHTNPNGQGRGGTRAPSLAAPPLPP